MCGDLQADACIRWTRQLCATSGGNAWRVAAKVLHETLGPSSVEELFAFGTWITMQLCSTYRMAKQTCCISM